MTRIAVLVVALALCIDAGTLLAEPALRRK
jgi:hypothetical protein